MTVTLEQGTRLTLIRVDGRRITTQLLLLESDEKPDVQDLASEQAAQRYAEKWIRAYLADGWTPT